VNPPWCRILASERTASPDDGGRLRLIVTWLDVPDKTHERGKGVLGSRSRSAPLDAIARLAQPGFRDPERPIAASCRPGSAIKGMTAVREIARIRQFVRAGRLLLRPTTLFSLSQDWVVSQFENIKLPLTWLH